MTEAEKWRRMSNPQTVEDWGLGVNIVKLLEEAEGVEIWENEIAPQLFPRYDLPKAS